MIRFVLVLFINLAAIGILLPSNIHAEGLTHTFKRYNFRIILDKEWQLTRRTKTGVKEPIAICKSKSRDLILKIYVMKSSKELSKQSAKLIKKWGVKSDESFTDQILIHKPELESEIISYNTDKSKGLVFMATDGLHTFSLRFESPEKSFRKNISSIEKIINGFHLNLNLKESCCKECIELSESSPIAKDSCSNFSESKICARYFNKNKLLIRDCH